MAAIKYISASLLVISFSAQAVDGTAKILEAVEVNARGLRFVQLCKYPKREFAGIAEYQEALALTASVQGSPAASDIEKAQHSGTRSLGVVSAEACKANYSRLLEFSKARQKAADALNLALKSKLANNK